MKALPMLRRQMRARRVAPARPAAAENNRLALQEALGQPVQARLKVGSPDDAHEREADAVAERVMAAPEPVLQRKCADCEKEDQEAAPPDKEEEARRKEKSGDALAGASVQTGASGGGGRPLPPSERAFFEPRMNADLGGVRIHADQSAARMAESLNARAFTVGGDVYFGAGEYRPGDQESRKLLAHELAHVRQQGGGESVQRKMDSVTATDKSVDVYVSIGLYGPNASSGLAATWKGYLENHWKQTLVVGDLNITARMHADVKHYPSLPDSQVSHLGIDEGNAVYVENAGFRSVVNHSCFWMDEWSCGRWAKDASSLTIAHEMGHMLGLEDKYKDEAAGSVDLPGYEKDIMANFWNDNGATDFTRAWFGLLIHHYFGVRG